MLGDPFRLAPQGPAHAYQTYQVVTPPGETHWRPASCAEVDCQPFLNGWETRLPATAEQMLHTVRRAGRPFTERTEDGEIVFTFQPGTPCFRVSTHRVKTGRPELFIVRDGDWRGNPTGQHRRHTRPEFWVEDMSEHLDQIKQLRERG